jgi:hypothetical protein
MEEFFVDESRIRKTDEREMSPWREHSSQFLLEEQLQEKIGKRVTEERIGETLFLVLSLLVWGWYVFWLYEAFQGYTIIPLP